MPQNRAGGESWLGPDKARHFLASALLTGTAFLVMNQVVDRPRHESTYFAGGIVFSVGLGKEVRDGRRRPGGFSFKDLVADIAGISFAVLLIQIR